MGKGSGTIFNLLTVVFLVLTFVVGGVVVATIASGSPDNESDVVLPDLPVVLALPTVTETSTPTVTPTPSITPTASNTLTATSTNQPTATETVLPTGTSIPPATATETNLPLTSTFTITPTFTQTALPTATSTSEAPQIVSFTASSTTTVGNTSITLTWQAVADTASIQRLNQQGVVQETFSVTPSGSLPVTVPNVSGQIFYRLIAQRGGQEVAQSITIVVQQACTVNWFFGNQFAQGCPLSAEVSAIGAYQLFERGLMIYVTAGGQNNVYGLNATNGQYMVYTNQWDGSTVYACPCGSPPSGLFDAQGVFNWVYNNTNGTVGPWWNASGIGWATINSDTNNFQTLQMHSDGVAFYIRIPGYGVIRLSGGAVTGTWTRVEGV